MKSYSIRDGFPYINPMDIRESSERYKDKKTNNNKIKEICVKNKKTIV